MLHILHSFLSQSELSNFFMYIFISCKKKQDGEGFQYVLK